MTDVVDVKSPSEFHNLFKDASAPLLISVFDAEYTKEAGQNTKTVLEALAEEHEDRAIFAYVDADKCKELTRHFQATHLPSVFVFSTLNKKLIQTLKAPKAEEFSDAVDAILENEITSLEGVTNENTEIFVPDIPTRTDAEDRAAKEKEALYAKLDKIIKQSPLMVFIKGSPDAVQCGFSRQMVAALNAKDYDYGYFDILSDNSVRQGLKEYSNWPTFPQVYLNGELLGGLDIIKEMIEDGSLDEMNPPKKLGKAMIADIEAKLKTHDIVVFMKGDAVAPRCKFSKAFVALMVEEGFKAGDYATFDILAPELQELRAMIKVYSGWPTFPQVYYKSKLVGGLDVIRELKEEGELQEILLGQKTEEELAEIIG